MDDHLPVMDSVTLGYYATNSKTCPQRILGKTRSTALLCVFKSDNEAAGVRRRFANVHRNMFFVQRSASGQHHYSS
nr:hypothetical protein [Tanacetum cinerariifolium]